LRSVSAPALTNVYNEKPIPFSTLYTLPSHEQAMPQVAAFVRQELLERLTHRAQKLDTVPLFAKSRNVVAVKRWYETAARELEAMPVPGAGQGDKAMWEVAFSKYATNFLNRHASTMMTMFRGAYELRALTKQDVFTFAEHHHIQRELDDFYVSRIGIRMLVGQYLALRPMPSSGGLAAASDSHVGMIARRGRPHDIAQEAIEVATDLCTRAHGVAPEVRCAATTRARRPLPPTPFLLLTAPHAPSGPLPLPPPPPRTAPVVQVILTGSADLSLPCVPAHLSYILQGIDPPQPPI